ncbi:MAG: kynureninase [Pseudomonadota bacterium]
MLGQQAKTAAEHDARDPLAKWRDRFHWPRTADGDKKCYLAGNSLGLQPIAASARVNQVLEDWASLGVEGHFAGSPPWLPYHRNATKGLANLLGCLPTEVVAMNTLTVNLNFLLLSFYRPNAQRYRIVIESDAFPSDRYAVQSQLALHGFDPTQDLIEWPGDRHGLSCDSLREILDKDDRIALMLLPGVQYLTGEVLDLESIGELAQRYQVTLGVDLAHAVGNVPIHLHEWNVDFGVFCSYKYLNAGPGAVGGAFVHEKHHGLRDGQLHGWWGNRESTRFEMRHRIDPAAGIDLWQQSNPPILSLAPLLASLDLFDDIGLAALRKKSIALTGYLRELIESHLSGQVHIITPKSGQGAQLSLRIKGEGDFGRRVFEILESLDVVCDWREPDVIRAAPAPLYNSFTDAWTFVQRLDRALQQA